MNFAELGERRRSVNRLDRRAATMARALVFSIISSFAATFVLRCHHGYRICKGGFVHQGGRSLER
jgi:hypothetical protein